MKSSKRIVAFLMALSVVGMDMAVASFPMNQIVASASEATIYSLSQDLEDVIASVGDSVVMTVDAPGTVDYHWQWSSDGSTWYDISNNKRVHSVLPWRHVFPEDSIAVI